MSQDSQEPDVPTESPADTATADEIAEALFDRQNRKARVGNERRHPRRRWNDQITIWIRKDRWDIPREIRVKSHDVSRGGFSFLYPQFLHADTLVSTRFDALPDQPIVSGIVKSCVYNGDGQHRVGVEFISSSSEDNQ